MAGTETDTQALKIVKDSVKHTPILCSTGCNISGIERQLSVADGAAYTTIFKEKGMFENTVDYNQVRAFMDKEKSTRTALNRKGENMYAEGVNIKKPCRFL